MVEVWMVGQCAIRLSSRRAGWGSLIPFLSSDITYRGYIAGGKEQSFGFAVQVYLHWELSDGGQLLALELVLVLFHYRRESEDQP